MNTEERINDLYFKIDSLDSRLISRYKANLKIFESLEDSIHDLNKSIQATNSSIECVIEVQKRHIGGETPLIKDPNSERIDKILSYITVHENSDVSYTFISNGDYSLRFTVESDEDEYGETLEFGLFADDDWIRNNATPKDFTIREGTIGEAKLGDLFVTDGELKAHSIEVVAFKVGDSYAVNFLDDYLLNGFTRNEEEEGIIFTRKQS